MSFSKSHLVFVRSIILIVDISTVNEDTAGALQSYEILADGSLSSAIETVSSGGDSPAFTVALSTGQVAIMNYNSGNGRVIPTTNSPLHFQSNDAPLITFPRPTGVSHPHMVLEHGQEILVPDLVRRSICSTVNVIDTDTRAQGGRHHLAPRPTPRHI